MDEFPDYGHDSIGKFFSLRCEGVHLRLEVVETLGDNGIEDIYRGSDIDRRTYCPEFKSVAGEGKR